MRRLFLQIVLFVVLAYATVCGMLWVAGKSMGIL
jgi:hypothetical protein